jgi:phosphate transport system substrate-binding protein
MGISWKALTAVLSLAILYTTPLLGASQSFDKSLQGPKFSKPGDAKGLVNANWKSKKITYPKSVGKPDIFVSLDQHFYPAAKPVIENYAKTHGLNVVIHEGTCGTSAGMVTTKAADITGYCCPPALSDRLPGLVFHTIGLIPNVLITHHDNPIRSVSQGEAQKLFSGAITSWQKLSDKMAKSYKYNVNPVTRLHCKIRPGHWRILLDNEDLHSPMIHNVSSIPDMKEIVAADPFSIGFIARWQMTTKELQRINMLKLNGIHPDDHKAVAQGRYPLYNVLNISTWSGSAYKQKAEKLVHHLIKYQDRYDPKMYIIPAKKLKAAGWVFYGNELIGEPGS